MINFNQRRAEKPFVKKVHIPFHETVDSEGEEELIKIVVESVNQNTPIEEQQKDVQMEDTKARLEDEAKENKGKQESSFWSKITFLHKFVGKNENPALSSESSPAVANKEEIGLMAGFFFFRMYEEIRVSCISRSRLVYFPRETYACHEPLTFPVEHAL